MSLRPIPSSALLILLATPVALVGQEPDTLPSAGDLIAAYVEAIGGREAHAAPTSIRSSGTLAVPDMEAEGEFELLQIPSVGSRMRTSLPGLGEMQMGFNGEAGWSVSDLTGPSLMDDQELAQVRERSLLEATLRSPEVIREAETVQRTRVDERECWRVRLTWASGRETFDCYDAETGLLVATEETQIGARGEAPLVTVYDDYREFHGMRLPTTLRQTTMGLEQIMRIQEVVVDDADEEDLAPPAPVRALLSDADGPGD